MSLTGDNARSCEGGEVAMKLGDRTGPPREAMGTPAFGVL